VRSALTCSVTDAQALQRAVDLADEAGYAGLQLKQPQFALADGLRLGKLSPAGVVVYPGADYSMWDATIAGVTAFAERTGNRHVCLVFPAGAEGEGVDAVALRLNELGARLREDSFELSVHNHRNSIIESLDQLLRLRDRLDPGACGITFDTAHAYLGGIGDLAAAYRSLSSHVTNVHVKDLDASGRFVPLGRGVLGAAIPPLIRALGVTGYEGWIVVDDESDLSEFSLDQIVVEQLRYLERAGVR